MSEVGYFLGCGIAVVEKQMALEFSVFVVADDVFLSIMVQALKNESFPSRVPTYNKQKNRKEEQETARLQRRNK